MKDEGGRMKRGYSSLEQLGAVVYAATSARRRRSAALPVPKKIEILVQMQRMAAPLLKAQGREAHVCKIGRKW